MTKIVKSPKKQSAKITKLKMRVGEIANMLLQNNPKMVRMRSGGSSGYADLFMSKQLMKGGKLEDKTQTAIVDFLKDQKNESAVKKLKSEVIEYLQQNEEDIKGIGDKNALISELNNDNVYDYKLCDKYDDTDVELQDNLITLDIVNKFYNLVKDKNGADGKPLLPKYPSTKVKSAAAIKIQSLGRRYIEHKTGLRNSLHNTSIVNLKEGFPSFLSEFLSKNQKRLENIDEDKKDVVGKVVGYLDYIFEQISSKINYILDDLKLLVWNKKNSKYELIEGQDSILSDIQLATLNNIIDEDNTREVIIFKYYTKDDDDDDINLDPPKINSYSIDDINKDLKDLEDYNSIIPKLLNDLKPIQVKLGIKQEEEEEGGGGDNQSPEAQGGKPPAKYKSTGRIVCIMYKKRKYKRTVYVKDKRNTKYCKIDGEYILLSKMKMIA